jgi:hypothetical protein
MTDLSPAAQAVLDAFSKYPLHGDRIAETLMHGALPAALRAAAAVLREAYANEEYVDPADDWLDDIAAELEQS